MRSSPTNTPSRKAGRLPVGETDRRSCHAPRAVHPVHRCHNGRRRAEGHGEQAATAS